MSQSINVFDPFLLTGRTGKLPKSLQRVYCKGGGGGSSQEYERQLAEQRQAREKAEAESAQLKQNQEATAAGRKKRNQASFLTGGDGEGDTNDPTKKSYLGAGN